MFYKILSTSLVLLGALHVGHAFFYGNGINESVMWEVSEGVTTILIGILNYISKAILLVSNALFIGYLILMVAHHMNVIPSYISLVLVLTCSMLVLNKKV